MIDDETAASITSRLSELRLEGSRGMNVSRSGKEVIMQRDESMAIAETEVFSANNPIKPE